MSRTHSPYKPMGLSLSVELFTAEYDAATHYDSAYTGEACEGLEIIAL